MGRQEQIAEVVKLTRIVEVVEVMSSDPVHALCSGVSRRSLKLAAN